MKKFLAIILSIVLVLSFASCAKNNASTPNENKEELTDIVVSLDWTPNTNHTGLYVALANGYYKEAGLNVSIVQPPEGDAIAACSSGQVQFAVGYQDLLAPAFTSETPMQVTAVAAILQHNSSCLIAKKGEGMDRPKGLEGKTFLTWESPVELAMMENIVTKDGGDWSKVKLIPNTVTDEAQDVNANPDHSIWVYYGWGVKNAEVQGVDVDTIMFNDINPIFDYYSPVLVANNDLLKNEPSVAEAFLDATRKGYEYAIEHPEEAAQILIDGDDTASLKGSEELVIASQKWMANEYKAEVEQWGYIDPARWNAFYNWLNEEELVSSPIAENTGFTNDYLA